MRDKILSENVAEYSSTNFTKNDAGTCHGSSTRNCVNLSEHVWMNPFLYSHV